MHDKDTVVRSHIRIVLLYTPLMNHFIIPKFDTHTLYTPRYQDTTPCQLAGRATKLLQNIIYNFTRRKSHDVTVKHIQVRTLATHIVVEIVGDVLQLGEGEALQSPHPWGHWHNCRATQTHATCTTVTNEYEGRETACFSQQAKTETH